ncbi:tRNA-specific adenosine deaminase [Aspergillus chevalieri]|uniref:A to I editase domain-containing protein n=1 Tax=Aspergillus chevalieri TaxID=182096 RepID=A0A7R7VF75_ASPCH|nr:uncharacterized protein ACHE_10918A [Aspergillus chevalieri]BCR83516.1 hypothetical protein ACHE_10918A [Aspergillus chevalieri]
MDSETLPSRIAKLVHEHFDALPARSKPTIHPDGSREWIPMTGIVIVKGENTLSERLLCVAVTTGAKCLSASQIPQCRGLVLHDCHAEILAIRAFNYWLLNESRGVLAQQPSPYVRNRQHSDSENGDWPPLELHPDIKIYMYCTCAPCGDASMELCMAAQEDPTPWELPPPAPAPATTPASTNADKDDTTKEASLIGRAHFQLLGVVRRKPARMDAESTRSKSCSDKLALRQVSSLLSCETSLLVAPTANVYLAGVICPEEEISRVACERAFGGDGRMKALNGRAWPETNTIDQDDGDQRHGYRFHPFKILSIPSGQIDTLYPFRKPSPCPSDDKPSKPKTKPGNVSAIWTIAPSHASTLPDHNPKSLPKLCGSNTGLYETLINGVKQGNRASAPLARGASALSRARLWQLVKDVIEQSRGLEGNKWETVLKASTYDELKSVSEEMEGLAKVRGHVIQDARKVLKGWVPNSGDEEWGLDVLIDPKKQKRSH